MTEHGKIKTKQRIKPFRRRMGIVYFPHKDITKLTSVFHASVLVLITNFVITWTVKVAVDP